MEKELWEQEMDFIYLIYFEWRYEWHYKNLKIIGRFGCINSWTYRNSKTWNKKLGSRFLEALLAPLAASLVELVISLVVKGISETGVKEGDIWMKIFSSAPSFKQYRDY